MNRVAVFVALVALGATGTEYWMRSRESKERDAVEQARWAERSKPVIEDAATRALAKWRSGRRLPIPERPPALAGLGGVRSLTWSSTSIEVEGPGLEACEAAGGAFGRGRCSWPIGESGAAGGAWPAGEDPPAAGDTLGALGDGIEALEGQIERGTCARQETWETCGSVIRVPVPALSGVGVFLERLSQWPVVVELVTWDRGRLDVTASVVGRVLERPAAGPAVSAGIMPRGGNP
ncbi:MAG: hypothetical protein HYY13_13495 [Nitrospirae bacterium]|nr:hypothetical protein [Nitrospirota bacterium]